MNFESKLEKNRNFSASLVEVFIYLKTLIFRKRNWYDFKSRKNNKNKIKPMVQKRKIFATIALAWFLLFGKARCSSSYSSSPNFGNQVLINNREFNLLEENDGEVILAKAESNPITPPTNRGPSNFPTLPSGGRPSPSVPGVNPYRVPPKVLNQGPGLGAGANSAGAGNGGGAAEFDDKCPAPNKEQSQESGTHHPYFTQERKKIKNEIYI